MKKQIGLIALVAALCGATQIQAADEPKRSPAQIARDEAQQLLKDRNEARPKAEAAVKKLREAGVRTELLGFDSAKALRDEQVKSGEKGQALDRYAKAAKQIEKKIQDEIDRGVRPPLAADIARFERLQAEVDLARHTGRLPAKEE
jgi:hypothetical protein